MERGKGQNAFSDAYGLLLEEFADQIGERELAYGEPNKNIREEIVRCIWFGSHFPPDALATDDGRRIEVLSPGWWNVEGGPDFVRAEFLLEGTGRVVGDVEVHTNCSSWYAHGHHRQPEYDDVVLHVVMWNDRGESEVSSQGGRAIPQLTLSRFVEEDVEELVEIVNLDGEEVPGEQRAVPGRYCGDAYREGHLRPEWLGTFLDAAGDYRIVSRAQKMEELFENHSREQILYERIAEALGYKNNRMAFLQLTSLVPVEKLRRMVPADAAEPEKALVSEAALFGVAGFLSAEPNGDADPETQDYLGRLREAWRAMALPLRSSAMSVEHWQFGGTRPVNYPTRRIAALAVLYAGHLEKGLFGRLAEVVHAASAEGRRRLDTVMRDGLADVFCGLRHPYWSRRWTFGGRPLKEEKALVGRGRAMSIIVDVLLPLLLAHGRVEEDRELEGRLHALWRHLPRRPDNAVTNRMSRVIFGGTDASREVVNSARRQQGLHQLYRDFCSTEDGCGSCVLYLASRAQKQLSVV